MNEQVSEYLRSNDRDLVGIGIELLQDCPDKESILKEGGFNYMIAEVWTKKYTSVLGIEVCEYYRLDHRGLTRYFDDYE